MRMIPLLIGAAVAVSAPPALAQTAPAASPDTARTPLPYDRGYDKADPRTDAINAAERPAVQAANGQVLAEDEQAAASGQTAYAQDIARYRAALRTRNRTIAQNDAWAARQERAYANAMADWRAQVAACDAGNRAACNAPGPDPATYM